MTLETFLVTNFRPGYEADTFAYTLAAILILLVLIYRTYTFFTKIPRKERLHHIESTIIITALLAVFVFLLYSSYYYWYSNVSTEGLVVCDGDKCRWAAHLHADISVSLCGKPFRLPLEAGRLDHAHTHKDGRIHWHSTIPTDRNKNILDKTPFQLGAFFDEINIRLTDSCIADTCTGDPCDGKPGQLNVFVNNAPVENARNYVWKDGDEIRILFE